MVVKLAIEDDQHRSILVEERLVPRRTQVDDREPPHPETQPSLDHQTLVVGPAMPDAGDHGRDLLGSNGPAVESSDADDPAHVYAAFASTAS
jgi:hypothetical protein